MLYSEFVAGTGCRENEHNYKVYKDLEIMYMESDMSKDEIYEYGKKLVDNSKSEVQIQFENELKSKIAGLKAEVERYTTEIEQHKEYMSWYPDSHSMVHFEKEQIKWKREEVKRLKTQIRELKSVLKDC